MTDRDMAASGACIFVLVLVYILGRSSGKAKHVSMSPMDLAFHEEVRRAQEILELAVGEKARGEAFTVEVLARCVSVMLEDAKEKNRAYEIEKWAAKAQADLEKLQASGAVDRAIAEATERSQPSSKISKVGQHPVVGSRIIRDGVEWTIVDATPNLTPFRHAGQTTRIESWTLGLKR